MFTKDQFKASVVALFGSKEEKAAQMRSALAGAFAFAWYHAAKHGNQAPFTQLGEAVAKGGGLKGAVREALKLTTIPRRTPGEDAALKEQAEAYALRALAMVDEAEKMQAEKRAAKKEERDAEKAEVEALRDAAKEQAIRDAIAATEVIEGAALVSPEGHPVALNADEWELMAEFLASLRATEVKSEPAPLAVAA